MKTRYKVLLFLSSFAMGLTMPILMLILCAHGANVKTLGLVLGVYTVVVISAEIPSGIFADIKGRKKSFMLSCVMSTVSYIALAFSNNLYFLIAAFAFSGLAAAFSSGSLDALVIDETVKKSGEKDITKTVSLLTVYNCLGIAAGAVVGGFIPNFHGYLIHIIIRSAAAFLIGIAAFLLIDERRELKGEKSVTLKGHIKVMAKEIKSSRTVLCLLISVTALAEMMASVEAYWQPRVMSINKGTVQSVLGFISAAGFGATTLASFLTGRLNLTSKRRKWVIYLSGGLLLAISIFILALQKSVLAFAAVYVISYFILGSMDVIEQTIMNCETTDSVRASMLSTISFASRFGGTISGFLGSAVLITGSISSVFSLFSVSMFAVFLLIAVYILISSLGVVCKMKNQQFMQ